MQSPLASGDDLAAQILGAREAEGRVANFILRLLLRLLQWEVSSRETCQSLWKLDFLLFAKYGKERQREYRELHLYGKALPLCNVPEAARQGIFRSSPRRVFFCMAILWELQERSFSMDRILLELDAQRAGFLYRGLQDSSRG